MQRLDASTNWRTVRSSRGLRLQKPLIEETGLGERVSLRVVDGGVLIEPRPKARAGWADAARLARERAEETEETTVESWPLTGFDIEEWEWNSRDVCRLTM